MRASLTRLSLLNSFTCTGASCEDTCCVGWGMQLDGVRKRLYEERAPELLNAVTSGEAEFVMRRDEKSGYCVKFEGGLCGIHRDYGSEFLGDACHFYPRITRAFGDSILQSATLSCPEIVRLMLEEETPFAFAPAQTDRLPVEMKHYLPEGVTPSQAFSVIQVFLNEAGRENATPEQNLARMISVARSLKNLPPQSWAEAVGFLFSTADSRLLQPELDLADPYRLMNTLAGLVMASPKAPRPRFARMFSRMQEAMGVEFDPASLSMKSTGEGGLHYIESRKRWQMRAQEALAPSLKKWMQGQVAAAGFPFSGFGGDPAERITLITLRYAILRLALMCHVVEDGTPPEQAIIIMCMQSLARVLDHLSDPTLSLAICEEAGWMRERRLLGLLVG